MNVHPLRLASRAAIAAVIPPLFSAFIACYSHLSEAPYGGLPTPENQITEPIDEHDLDLLGCDKPHIVCVNACTGTLATPGKVPLATEGEPIVIRAVGWESCKPKQFACDATNVPNLDVSYRDISLAPAPPSSGTPPQPPPNAPPPAPAASTNRSSMDSSAAGVASEAQEDAQAGNDRIAVAKLLAELATPGGRKWQCADPIPVRAAADFLASTKTYADTRRSIAGARLATSVSATQSLLDNYQSQRTELCNQANANGAAIPGAALRRLYSIAARVNAGLRQIERDAARAFQWEQFTTRGIRLAAFGDCVMTIPLGVSVRQVAFDVKFTPFDFDVSDAGSVDGSAEGGLPIRADGGAPTRDALVFVDIDHGKYFWDVGLLTAVVPFGQRNVLTAEIPGIPGSRRIIVDERGAVVTAIALNIYPLGHRREAYSFLEHPRTFRRGLGDAMGLQLGLNTDLKNATSLIAAGVIFEPITGLSLNLGAICTQGDFLKPGYVVGLPPAANRDDFVTRSSMIRFYFGFTAAYELLHTTTSRLSAIKQDLGN